MICTIFTLVAHFQKKNKSNEVEKNFTALKCIHICPLGFLDDFIRL